MTTILKVVVGSKLHGLANETSDTDYRGIFVHPLIDKLSPFRKIKNVSWIEGDVDNTAYELSDFCKYASYGNPTILEILWSNQVVESTKWGEVLQANKKKFLNSERIYEAHKGYAHNQYNKMNLFEPDDRTPKFAVAYIRSLMQAIQLLETGDFSPQIDPREKDFLLRVKYNYDPGMINELSTRFSELQQKLAEVHARHHHQFTPDVPWIEDFLMQVYTEELCKKS